MDALTSMKQKLKPLGLYKLTADTVVGAEVSAYAEGLDNIITKLEELERECFIATATSYGLDLREKLFEYQDKNQSVESRRELLLFRGAVTANDYTKASIEHALSVCGMDASIIENTVSSAITINNLSQISDSTSEEEIKTKAKEFLPTHLTVNYDFSTLTWNVIDTNDFTFAQMDGADLTWAQIDNY